MAQAKSDARNVPRYVALTGGVGGAKLALGLSRVLGPEQVTFVVNTGDDFEHLGLRVSPDLDTLMYTLAGVSNPELGWGRRDETWHFIETLAALGGEAWFRIGDRDLAVHVERTMQLRAGVPLTEITRTLCSKLGVPYTLLPMSDQQVATVVQTTDGSLPFQHYFVRERCAPVVTGFRFDGLEHARLNPKVEEALADPALAGVIVCPSNPFVSVDPILAVPGMRERLRDLAAPVIAVSPIVGGAAIKGPTAKMMTELGLTTDAYNVAKHYEGLLDAFVLDKADAALSQSVRDLGLEVTTTNTVMVTLDDRIALAKHCIVELGRLR
jgi:LPPG:FO 2-phospho-L-lactate transferase